MSVSDKTFFFISVDSAWNNYVLQHYLPASGSKSIPVFNGKICFFYLIYNLFYSLYILIKEKPDIIVTTGVLSIIPLCLIGKFFGVKLIYIESFAKIHSPTKTGKLLYKFADKFFVQWESMKEVYPKAIFVGGLY